MHFFNVVRDVRKHAQFSKLANAGAKGTYFILALNTTYTASSDGYLQMSGGSSAGSAVIVEMYDKSGTHMFTIFEVTPVANLGSSSAIYVKKGMIFKATRLDTGAAAIFNPFSY